MSEAEKKKKKIASNTAYTIAGALVLNGVLQLFVYPRLNAEMGAESIGTVLYLMAFVNILGPSIGQAMNNSRLVLRRDHEVTNGDYDLGLLLFGAVGICVSLVMARGSLGDAGTAAAVALVILVTIFRYYGDVEYRLSLNYRNYFIYYTACGAGYAVGYGVYRLTGRWVVIFLAGEACALLYVAVTGDVFRRFFRRSVNFGLVLGRGATLTVSYFLTNLTLNIDRLVLQNQVGAEAVTQYYVASLIGKTLVLFIAPVNTIMISYLTREKTTLDRRQFLRFAGMGIGVGAVFFLLCQIGTPIFVRLFYPDLAASTRGIYTVVNLTQILAMLSAYLFILVLTFAEEKWQLILQGLHLAILLVLVFTMTKGSIRGFSYAVLIANSLRILAVLTLGGIKARK